MTHKEIRRTLANLSLAAEATGDADLAQVLAQVHQAVLFDEVPSLCVQLSTQDTPVQHPAPDATTHALARSAVLLEQELQ